MFFFIMLLFIYRYKEHDEGVAFAERGDPSVHPSNHPSDATTAKETTLLPNQCKPMHFFLQFANSDFVIRKKFTLHSELNGKCGRLIV